MSSESQGLQVAVPTPLPKMREILTREILTKKGFTPHVEVDPVVGEVEVWERVIAPLKVSIHKSRSPSKAY